MTSVLTSVAVARQKAASQGIVLPFASTGFTGTAALAASGFITVQVGWNTVGTVISGGPYYGIDLPTTLAGQLRILSMTTAQTNNAVPGFLAFLYKIGTLNLSATGAQFTHNANWSGSIKRTNGAMGTATAINMTPIVVVTTATATTAPVFNINSYVDQVGSTITGAKTMTMPAAATVAGSGFVSRLEDGDSGVQDITAINVSVAGSAGAATVYGMEVVGALGSENTNAASTDDQLISPPRLTDINPASVTPNSGTLTYNTDFFLVPIIFGQAAANVTNGVIYAIQDN